MIEAAAKRFASSLRLSSSTRGAPRVVGRPLDTDVQRGYERARIEDMTMARTFPYLEAMTLETMRAGKTAVRRRARRTAFKQAVA